ncbi:zinc ABC transporter substrate-binding protein [Novispirillum itersonii]|uniref:zinc ABC transporter substrate-binding protein n=1 Tax=Novispirillum itersonii TaxID=189 RepID=UPI000364FFE5|nr:zinc ABC transporter substrate-binding protein [Novispirillum itersonii]
MPVRPLLRSVTLATTLALTGTAVTARADSPVPVVVTSITPVYALTGAIMEGVGEPVRLIPQGQSPHTHVLKPSDARAVSKADVIFWVGPELEGTLPKTLTTAPKTAQIVPLLRSLGEAALPLRDGENWESGHDHDHDHGHSHGHDHGKATADEHEDGLDPHAWLDPQNAKAWAATIAATLSARDPAHAMQYAANLTKTEQQLTALETALQEKIAPAKAQKVLVFHDAYQYLERRFGLQVIGAVTIDPSRAPSAKHLKALQAKVQEQGVTCLYAEPEFPDAVLRTVAQGVKAKVITVDPDGGAPGKGFAAYEAAMQGVATAVASCAAAG